ncbi:MAG: hypothetical protein ACRCVV_10600 [Shewanella sp.]
MIETLVKNELISASEINSLMDKSTLFAIRDSVIEGPGYISNINSITNIYSCRLEDIVLVVKNDDSKALVLDSEFHNGGIRLVNVVCGYAYTHQVSPNHSHGVVCF